MRMTLLVILILTSAGFTGCISEDEESDEPAMKRPAGRYLMNTNASGDAGQAGCLSEGVDFGEEDDPCIGVDFDFLDFYTNISEHYKRSFGGACSQGEIPSTNEQGVVCKDSVEFENRSEFTFDGDDITIRGNYLDMDLRYAWVAGGNVEELLVLKRTDSSDDTACKVYVSLDDIPEDTTWNNTANLFAGYVLPSWC